jgi:TRAP transporter TAXI family solute receptor
MTWEWTLRAIRRAVLAGALLLAAGCDRDEPNPAPRQVVRLASGFPGGFSNAFGNVLAKALSSAMPTITVQIVQTGGAISNVEFLQQGRVDLAVTFADAAYQAYVGRLPEHPGTFDRIRGIAVLQPTTVQVLVPPHSAVTSISDLRGRRVALGPPGSGTSETAKILLEAFNVPVSSVHAESISFVDATARVARGELDAAFVSAGHPAEVVNTATRAGSRLLDINGPLVVRLRNEYPFLRATVIPQGTYGAVPRAVNTVGIDTVLTCAASLDEELVYRLTRVFFDLLPRLSHELDALRRVDLARSPATSIPLHEGAARYYRERELSR